MSKDFEYAIKLCSEMGVPAKIPADLHKVAGGVIIIESTEKVDNKKDLEMRREELKDFSTSKF